MSPHLALAARTALCASLAAAGPAAPPGHGDVPPAVSLERAAAARGRVATGVRAGGTRPAPAGPGCAPPARAATRAAPRAPGDRLVVSAADGFRLAPALGWDGRLAPSPGVAAAGDRLAFRFPAGALAASLPVRLAGLVIGVDNRFGRTAWPRVGVALEDPLAPLAPPAALAAWRAWPEPASQLPPVAAPPGPDAFAALPVDLAPGVLLDPALAVDDGAWSDDFDRPVEAPLDNPGSDWLECRGAGCPGPRSLVARGGRAVKTLAGDAIGVKLPAADVAAVRPARDLDVRAGVAYDATAPAAARAGIALRIEAPDRLYLVEYVKAANEVALSAVTPGGVMRLAGSGGLGAARHAGRLEVEARGVNPAARIDVALDGVPLFSHADATYRLAGELAGIASLGGSSGEAWDDFTVQRAADAFAVLELPPGEDAALPAEYSPGTLGAGNVLASRAGGPYAPVPAPAGCRAPNGFVQLVVEDATADGVDDLFAVETHLVSLALECPTCPDTRNLCSAARAPEDARLPVVEVGRPVALNAGWWNEHVPDQPRLWLRFSVRAGDCDDPLAPVAASRDVVPIDDPGQASSGVAYRTLAAPGLDFVPAAAGPHCAEVLELYDGNGDGCPDGHEGTPCPAGCACVGDPDGNAGTAWLRRPFRVEPPCTPVAVPEIDPRSLRLARDGADPSLTLLAWRTGGAAGRTCNLHVTPERTELAEPHVREALVPWARLAGSSPETRLVRELPAAPAGGVLHVVVFETDGCPSGWSLPDP